MLPEISMSFPVCFFSLAISSAGLPLTILPSLQLPHGARWRVFEKTTLFRPLNLSANSFSSPSVRVGQNCETISCRMTFLIGTMSSDARRTEIFESENYSRFLSRSPQPVVVERLSRRATVGLDVGDVDLVLKIADDRGCLCRIKNRQTVSDGIEPRSVPVTPRVDEPVRGFVV